MLQHSQAVLPSNLGRTQEHELGTCHPILVAVSKLWPLSFWFWLFLRIPGAQTLAYSLFVLPALCCNLKQVVGINAGQNKVSIDSCILCSAISLYPKRLNPVYKFGRRDVRALLTPKARRSYWLLCIPGHVLQEVARCLKLWGLIPYLSP